jgi:hypothetical protein
MAVDWSDIASKVIGLGAPILGSALGGPIGAAAGNILAEALGAPESTPTAVGTTLSSIDPAVAAAAARQAESEWLDALAEIGKTQVSEVAQTQRAELVSGDLVQRWWRPIYALELSLLECPAFALTMLHALWMGHEAGINGFASLSALWMTYFGARFGVLGVYVSGRTREKQAAATGELPPTVIGQFIKALAPSKKK